MCRCVKPGTRTSRSFEPDALSNVCSQLPHPHHTPILECLCDIRSAPPHLRKRLSARTVGTCRTPQAPAPGAAPSSVR
ncbi:hypothetical protein SAM23877_1800 [Streptomyces ambofaciens ATCC 23877]|uniref:Uncharacterized protein n=1 Tax=Streptomyces ambofaciens (strain ATCC 23877 / 3486 / DSM 40053 / JCM 4204 / NBRC 12836 / NRRL B-2516) TaxID=278992 RepID=A0A0K2APE1_STRA7|nr:hypothetical protein SAM23877_1800 [Streptomyces ambofaciens ATCC 23877]